MRLRDYEADWIKRIERSGASRKLIVGPTGSGKTVVAAAIMRKAIQREKRVLFVVHRRELATQAIERLRASGVGRKQIGALFGGLERNRDARIQVAGIQTLARIGEPPDADVVFVDEAHHAHAKTYRTVLNRYPSACVYGLTATPYRLDGQSLGDLFDDIIQSAPPSKLIESGWLQKPLVYTVPNNQRPDLSAIPIHGDYDTRALAKAVNRKELVGSIVDHWRKHADGRPAVCYAVNVEHGERITQSFLDVGARAAMLHSKTSPSERSSILDRLQSGGLSVVVNCMVLTEGWDCPSVKLAIVARPTMSTGLWVQMIGRITRPTRDGKQPIVLDHTGNALVHGLPLEDVNYSLEARIGRRRRHGSVAEKACPVCANTVSLGLRVCCFCAYEWWQLGAVPPNERPGELVRYYAGTRMCEWDGCPTPHLPVSKPKPGKPGRIHMSCKRARSLAARHCRYEHCLTPGVLLQAKARTHGTTMHMRCLAHARKKAVVESTGKGRSPAQHGTRSRYTSGCRCLACKTASAAYMRDYYERKHTQTAATPRSTV